MPFYVLFRKENIPYNLWGKCLKSELHQIYLMKQGLKEDEKDESPIKATNKYSFFNFSKMFRFQKKKKKFESKTKLIEKR